MQIWTNLQLLLLLVGLLLGHLEAQTALKSSWPQIPSQIKLLGLFPKQVANDSTNNIWIIHCRSMFRAAILLSQQYNITLHGHFISYDEITTDDDIMVTVDQTCQKVSTSNILGFVGPAYSSEAKYLASFAYRLGIISVSYSATSSELSTIYTGAFQRIVPSDENTVLGLITFFQQYGWKSAIIIYENDEYGYNGMRILSEKFREMNIKILTSLKFDIKEQDFQVDLRKTILNSFSRIVIVWANEKSTTTILKKALEADVIGSSFVWILTSTVLLNDFDQKQQQNLVGTLIVEPIRADLVNASVNRALLNASYEKWNSSEPETFPGDANVSSYALFTFDAAWSLILSLQQLCSVQSSCLEFLNVSNCYNRQFVNWKEYYQILRTMTFSGVSGDVKFSSSTADRVGNAYYIMKNIQPINPAGNQVDYISIRKWSVGETNWTYYKNESGDILWPSLSNRVPLDYKLIHGNKVFYFGRNSFCTLFIPGQPLRIGVINSPPFVVLKNATASDIGMKSNYTIIDQAEFDGFFKDILIYLQSRMNFIPIVMLVAPTTTYNQLVEGVANDLFDTAMTSLVVTPERTQIVDFSSPLLFSSIQAIVRKRQSSLHYFFFKPFTLSLWLMILATILYASFLLWHFEQHRDTQPKTVIDANQILTMVSSIRYVFYALLGRNHPYNVRTDAGRLLIDGVTILQIILSALFLARVVSFVTIPIVKPTISGIDAIKNGDVLPNRVGIVEGSAIEEFYLKYISQGNKNYYSLKSTNEIYTRLISEDVDIVLWTNVSIAYYVNVHCDLMSVGAPLSFSWYSIPVRKEWPYTTELDANILSLTASEQFDRISAKLFEQHELSKEELSNTESKPIPIDPMRELFIAFIIIGFLSILTYYWMRRSAFLPIRVARVYYICVDTMHYILLFLRMPEVVCIFFAFFLYLLCVLLCLLKFPK